MNFQEEIKIYMGDLKRMFKVTKLGYCPGCGMTLEAMKKISGMTDDILKNKTSLLAKLTTLHSSADASVANAEADRAIIKFTLAAFPDIAEAYDRVPKKFV